MHEEEPKNTSVSGLHEGLELRPPELDYIFHPRSIALVGASDHPQNTGNVLLAAFLKGGYKGGLYPVHPTLAEVMGLTCYPDLRSIPYPVDHVFVGIPAQRTPDLMHDCAAKGVRVCHFFTAGFSELGTAEGRALEMQILEIARTNGIRLIGPNSMGIYCPSSGLYLAGGLPHRSGHLGLLSQSGGNSIYLCRTAAMRGAAFSKAVSYGNGCDLDESDLLDYFSDDHDTRVITAYIEGVKNGLRFRHALRKAADAKPTILLKGGKTECGALTVRSHTGALAGSTSVWDGLIQQTGALQVDDLDELIDLALLFLYMKPPRGRRVAVVGLGGGISVFAADAFHGSGLLLPRFSEELKTKLLGMAPTAGNICDNPMDTSILFFNPDLLRRAINAISQWEGIDLVCLHLAYDIIGWDLNPLLDSGLTHQVMHTMVECTRRIKVPVCVVLHHANRPTSYEACIQDQQICWEAGLPVFLSMDKAAKALSRFITYHQKRIRLFS